jgi:carbamoyltransferase
MKVLGLYDWHNCGASLIEDGKIIAAIEEERLSRNKIEFGFPYRSIQKALEITGTDWDEIDAIAVASMRDPFPLARLRADKFKFRRKMDRLWSMQYALWRVIYRAREILPLGTLDYRLNRAIVTSKIRRLIDIPAERIYFVDHHLAHAASGYRTSGFNEALVFALDGSGDGFSTTVYLGSQNRLQFLAGASERASLGKLYSNVTLGLNFKKISDEGKVMGLAAGGNSEVFFDQIDPVIQIRNLDNLDLYSPEDLIGNSYAKKITKLNLIYSREDISAATQRKLEETVKQIVTHFVKKTGMRKVVIVGGVASNVLMNQAIREMDEVEETFIFPNMTDGGLSTGAALEVCYELSKARGEILPVCRLENVYLGPEYSEKELHEAINHNNLAAEYVEDIEAKIADLIVAGKIVARFAGRMEFGPRALGNRSILALPTRPGLENELNERLNRDEFMPFAPSMLEDVAIERYLIRGRRSPYMTETFDVTDYVRQTYPPIVHLDNTCRPQTVSKQDNSGYWRIIKQVGDQVGHYVLLNTSYNMHGEPIVCSPQDAINTFLHGCVDYLALGNFLIKYESNFDNERY